jgi:L-lysine exporter family protein LysE/ArgO
MLPPMSAPAAADLTGAFSTGFALGGGLIVAIGAQNAYLLRMGLVRAHPTALALLAATIDTTLIALGLLGAGALLQAHPGWALAMRWAGAAFLAAYAVAALRRALRGGSMPAGDAPVVPLRQALLTLAGFSLLNPHVYLDTVVLVGAIGAQQPDALRPAFGMGAACASFVWFLSLTHGARWLAPVLATPRAWAVLDGLIGLTMAALALGLVRG